jgi:membrane dipeptidase
MVDSHEDIAWNMLTFGRDYRLSSLQTRQKEAGSIIPVENGDTMLGMPEYRLANMAVIFATLFAAPFRTREGDWDFLTYKDSREAHRMYMDQLDAYERLTQENPDFFRTIKDRKALSELISEHQSIENSAGQKPPIGLIYLMEGADGIREPQEAEDWYEHGVRIFGLAWHGTRYSGGTREPGPLTPEGVELVRQIEALGGILDISHMDELAVRQAFDRYHGAMIASHSNPYAPVKNRPSNRFLSDDVILQLAERGGVIGVIPYNLFLDANWEKNDPKDRVSITTYVDHIDYVCQLLGSADHVGIGTDFDGGFGYQSSPAELNTLADLGCIIPLLEKKGYTQSEIEKIFGMNWTEFMKKHLPER